MKKEILTPELKSKIEELGSKGVPDNEIARQLNLKVGMANSVTTKYWERKMEEKNG